MPGHTAGSVLYIEERVRRRSRNGFVNRLDYQGLLLQHKNLSWSVSKRNVSGQCSIYVKC